jgi:hypothetical protein
VDTQQYYCAINCTVILTVLGPLDRWDISGCHVDFPEGQVNAENAGCAMACVNYCDMNMCELDLIGSISGPHVEQRPIGRVFHGVSKITSGRIVWQVLRVATASRYSTLMVFGGCKWYSAFGT